MKSTTMEKIEEEKSDLRIPSGQIQPSSSENPVIALIETQSSILNIVKPEDLAKNSPTPE